MFKKLLKKYNLRQRQVAEVVGKTQQAVARWCTGQTEPSIGDVFEISKAFDIPIMELVECFRKKKIGVEIIKIKGRI